MNKFIRHIKICLIVVFVANHASSQVQVSHKNDWFFVEPGTEVYIKGQLKSLKNNAQPISNLGGMHIIDSVICYGDNKIFGVTPDTTTANVYLYGDKKQIFAGDKNMRFGNLYIRNTYDSLEVWNNVEIYNFIQLDSGNIKLVSNNLDLLNTGRLIGETNEKRVFTNEYGKIHLERPLVGGNTYTDLAGTGLDITINGNLGTSVDVYRGNHQQPNASNGSIDRYYTFSPQQNGYVSKPNIHYLDSNELQGFDENTLSMYKSESAGVTWVKQVGVVNTITDKVSSDPATNFVLTSNTMLTLAGIDCDSLPFLEFPKDTVPLCGGAPAFIKPNGIAGMSSVWSTGIENKDSIQVTTAGTYMVTITDLAGCPNSDSVVVIIADNPIADYSISPVCFGDSSKVKNRSSIASGTISYKWEMGDVYTAQPDTISDSIASIIYTNQGTYTTSLVLTSNYGCIATLSKNAIALPYPVIDYTVTNSCEDSNLVFTNNTTVTPSAGIVYKWDFGNSDTNINALPIYAFDSFGNKSIILSATSNGCTSTVTKNIDVHPNPIANYSNSLTCIGSQTTFTNLSSVATGSIANNYWTFESGSNATLINPTYTFSNAGNFPVKLKITSNKGCENDTIINIDIRSLPAPAFSFTNTCMGDSIQFVNTSSSTSLFHWSFNSQDSSILYSPSYLFNTSGNKSVVLTETDSNGCIGTIVKTINSLPRPTANYTLVNGCENENLAFLNSSSTPLGSINYAWDFKNGNSSTLKNPSNSFSISGNYAVQLVASVGGCSDTISKSIIVNPTPVLNLGSVISTCANQYQFNAQNTGATYLWNDNSTSQTLSTTYNGQYWVKVTNSFGCEFTDSVQLNLSSVVLPNLGPDSTFCDAQTLDAGYPGATFLWNTSATTQSINITTSGTYWVQVTDVTGCVGIDTINATVVSSILPNLGPDISTCNGITTTLNPSAIGTYLWNNAATTSTLDVTNSGSFWVQLTDLNGCVNNDTIQVTYNTNPTLNLGLDGGYCDSKSFDVTQTGVTYLWENSSVLPTRTLSTNGLFWVELTDVTSTCSTRDTINMTFSATPSVSLGNDTTLCGGTSILLDAQNGVGGNSFSWNVGSSSQTLFASSTGQYVVLVTTPLGCIGKDTIQITVNPPLNTFLGIDKVLCAGSSTQLSSPIAGANYQWSLNGSILPSISQSITATTFGNYSILVTDNFGCTSSDTISLLQTGSFIEAKFLATTVGPVEGDTIQFINLSNPSPYTSVWDFGDGSFSIDEDPIHTYLFPGNYTVKLTVSNGVCSADTSKSILVVPVIVPQKVSELADTILNSFVLINLFPNPNNGNYTLKVELLEEGHLTINCFSMIGKMIFDEKLYGKDFNLNYDNTHLAKGIYLMRLKVNEEIKTLKFIIQ